LRDIDVAAEYCRLADDRPSEVAEIKTRPNRCVRTDFESVLEAVAMEGELVRVKTKAAEGRAFAPQIRAFAKKVAITETRYAEESEPE
jgi:hypothetical protein